MSKQFKKLLEKPIYINKPYILLSADNITLSAGTLDAMQALKDPDGMWGDYYKEATIETRTTDLHGCDNTKHPEDPAPQPRAGESLMLRASIETRQLTEKEYALDDESMKKADNKIRIYKSSPTGFTLQLRSIGNINGAGSKGATRRMISTASYLGLAELDAMIEKLRQIREAIA